MTLFSKKILAGLIRILRSYHPGLPGWGQTPMPNVLVRDRKDKHGGESHVKREAEVEVRQPQAKLRLEPPQLGKTRKDSTLEPVEGA